MGEAEIKEGTFPDVDKLLACSAVQQSADRRGMDDLARRTCAHLQLELFSMMPPSQTQSSGPAGGIFPAYC
jgi:hypothetical protein